MTVAEQKAQAQEYADLWQALMPSIELPGYEEFLIWAGNYTEKQVTRGINGAARKLRAMRNINYPMSPDDVARYCSSIIRNEATGRRNFN